MSRQLDTINDDRELDDLDARKPQYDPTSDSSGEQQRFAVERGKKWRTKLDHVATRRWMLLEVAARHLPHARFKVFFYLVTCSRPDLSRCRPRLRVIAEAIGMHRRQVAAHIAALVHDGWLVRTRRGRRGSLTTFRVPPGALHPWDGAGWAPPEDANS